MWAMLEDSMQLCFESTAAIWQEARAGKANQSTM